MENLKTRLEFLIGYVMEKFRVIESLGALKEDRMLSVEEAVAYTGRTDRSLRRYRVSGQLKAYPLGGFIYYRESELRKLIDAE